AAAVVVATPDEREALRRSHLYMYELYGDPAMPIRYPGFTDKVRADPESVAAGAEIVVTASFEGVGDGEAVVTLESTRRVVLSPQQPLPADGDPKRDAVIVANYEGANNKALVSQVVSHLGGKIWARLLVPYELPPADYHVKIHAHDGIKDVVGSAKVTVIG